MVYLETPNAYISTFTNEERKVTWDLFYELRRDEISFIVMKAKDETEFVAAYSILNSLKLQSWMNIGRNCFLCIVLTVASF